MLARKTLALIGIIGAIFLPACGAAAEFADTFGLRPSSSTIAVDRVVYWYNQQTGEGFQQSLNGTWRSIGIIGSSEHCPSGWVCPLDCASDRDTAHLADPTYIDDRSVIRFVSCSNPTP